MQIIIAQLEIEQAIQEFIGRKIKIADDQRIDIDLKATRGDAGYQAFIDIVDQTSERRPSEQDDTTSQDTAAKPTQAKSTTTTVAAATTTTGRRTRAAAQPAPAQEPEVQAAASDNSDAGGELVAAEAEPEMATADADQGDNAQVSDTPAEAPRKSLFGGLSRPNNG